MIGDHPSYPYHNMNRSRRIVMRFVLWFIVKVISVFLLLVLLAFCLGKVGATVNDPYQMERLEHGQAPEPLKSWAAERRRYHGIDKEIAIVEILWNGRMQFRRDGELCRF